MMSARILKQNDSKTTKASQSIPTKKRKKQRRLEELRWIHWGEASPTATLKYITKTLLQEMPTLRELQKYLQKYQRTNDHSYQKFVQINSVKPNNEKPSETTHLLTINAIKNEMAFEYSDFFNTLELGVEQPLYVAGTLSVLNSQEWWAGHGLSCQDIKENIFISSIPIDKSIAGYLVAVVLPRYIGGVYLTSDERVMPMALCPLTEKQCWELRTVQPRSEYFHQKISPASPNRTGELFGDIIYDVICKRKTGLNDKNTLSEEQHKRIAKYANDAVEKVCLESMIFPLTPIASISDIVNVLYYDIDHGKVSKNIPVYNGNDIPKPRSLDSACKS